MSEKVYDQREALYATGKWGKVLQPERAKSYMEEVSESRQYMESQQRAREYNAERFIDRLHDLQEVRKKTHPNAWEAPQLERVLINSKRYELLRTLNPRQFQVLWDRCLERDLKFDDVVDEMMGERT